MAADRQRQQYGAAELPFFLPAMKADSQRDGAKYRAKHDRRHNKHRIPQDDCRHFKRGHPGVVHHRNAAGDDSAADPWTMAVWSERYCEPRLGQQDGHDQRQDGQHDVIAARDSRSERKHRDEVRRPDTEARRYGRHRKPYASHVALRSPGMAKEVDRRK
jgi:hypothetical protein